MSGVCVCRWFEVGVLLTNYSKVLGGSSAPISGVFPYIPGLVNIQKTNWKDPPCYQWVVIHYFDWAMFNFANSLKKSPEGFCGSSPTPLPNFSSDPYVPFPNRKTICALPPAAKKLGHKNSIRALLLGKRGHQWEDVTHHNSLAGGLYMGFMTFYDLVPRKTGEKLSKFHQQLGFFGVVK